MELCRVVLFLHLCGGCYGQTYIPANLNLRLGGGYDFGYTKVKSPALQSLPACGSTDSIACKKNVTKSYSQSYTHSVKTREDYNQLLSIVTKAEGGGWGVSVSAGVTAMQDSNTSESSWTYFVGSGVHSVLEEVTNVGKLLLTDTAKTYLAKDPMGFLDVYGKHYISSIVYGGSFMGSISLTEKDQSDTSDLDVFASVKVDEAFYNVEASADFEEKIESTSSTVERWAQVNYRGGGVIPSKTDTPKDIGDMYVAWQESIEANPEPLLMTVRPYFDSEEVQAIVLNQGEDVIAAFAPTTITQTTMDQFSNNYGILILVLASIEQALGWSTTKSSETLQDKLETLLRTCTTYKIQYEEATEIDILVRQSEIEDGNYSWFRANTYLDEFEEIKENFAPTPGPVYRPDVVRVIGQGTVISECPEGEVLTSCGLRMHATAEPYWSVYPTSNNQCTCYDSGYGDGEAECSASCVDESVQTIAYTVKQTSQGVFRAECPSGYKVTGCGIDQHRDKEHKEKYSYVYPYGDGGCECYNNLQDVDCYAICSKNVENYEIVSDFGEVTFNVTCPDGTSALGCGFEILEPGKQSAEEYPGFYVQDWNMCACYNRYGARCFAMCGNITGGTSSLSSTAVVSTGGFLI